MNRCDVRVYVAGPLTGTNPTPVCYIANLHRMLHAANDIHHMGVAPYIPGEDFLRGIVAGDFLLNDYQRVSSAWLKAAHVVFRMGGESRGADAEVGIAHEHDIPVVHNFVELEKIVRSLTGEEQA